MLTLPQPKNILGSSPVPDEPQQESLIPADIRAMSNDELISEHRKIGDHVTVQTKAFTEYLKPAKDRMDWIEKQLFIKLAELNKGKTEGKRASISTDAGTAYLSTIVTPKVVDREKYLDWCLEDWDNRGGMLQISAPQKDAWNEYIDQHKENPPFTESNSFTRVNIRRS